MNLQELKEKAEDFYDSILTNPKKLALFCAGCGVIIGVMLGRL